MAQAFSAVAQFAAGQYVTAVGQNGIAVGWIKGRGRKPVAEPVTGETQGELSLEVLSELVEFYREAETQWGWRETVRMLAVFQPDVGVVRRVAERAYDLANEERVSGNPGEQASYMGAGDALTILADRVEQQRK